MIQFRMLNLSKWRIAHPKTTPAAIFLYLYFDMNNHS